MGISSSDNMLALACGGDDAFAMPIAVCLYSAVVNLEKRDNVSIFIIDGGFSDQSKNRIRQVLYNVDTYFLTPDFEKLNGLPTLNHINKMTYLRIMLPHLLPKWVEQVVYLDGDMVVNTDLRKLTCEIDHALPVSAVRDFGGPYAGSQFSLGKRCKVLEIKEKQPFFNAGMLGINVNLWLKKDISKMAFNYINKNLDLIKMVDQEALNVVLSGKWKELDPKWNVQVGALQSIDLWEDTPFKKEMCKRKNNLMTDPYIAHFIGPGKPWKAGLFNPLRPLFTQYLRQSDWFSSTEFQKWYFRWLLSGTFEAAKRTLSNPSRIFSRI